MDKYYQFEASNPDFIYIIDKEGNVVFTNQENVPLEKWRTDMIGFFKEISIDKFIKLKLLYG